LSLLAVPLFLIGPAVWRLRSSFQARGFNLASAHSAPAVAAVLKTAERVPHIVTTSGHMTISRYGPTRFTLITFAVASRIVAQGVL
jgi:hypothetical protein